MIPTAGLTNLFARGIVDMKDHFSQIGENAKYIIDALSVATVIGTLVEMLPSVAAIFTIIWTAIRIWETDTVQKFLKKDE